MLWRRLEPSKHHCRAKPVIRPSPVRQKNTRPEGSLRTKRANHVAFQELAKRHSPVTFLFRAFVGLVQPPQGVAQIARGTNLKGKPALSRRYARVLEGAFLQIWWHGVKPENDRIGSVESPCDR